MGVGHSLVIIVSEIYVAQVLVLYGKHEYVADCVVALAWSKAFVQCNAYVGALSQWAAKFPSESGQVGLLKWCLE